MNELATLGPDWLRGVAPVEWYQRYSRRIEDDRLPDSKEKRAAYAQTVGEDGFVLLDLLQGPEAPPQFGQLPSIAALRQVLARHYECVMDEPEGGDSTVRYASKPTENYPQPLKASSPLMTPRPDFVAGTPLPGRAIRCI